VALYFIRLNWISDLAGKEDVFGNVGFEVAGGDLLTRTDPDCG
jgi:polyribonucleotide nucleotidyltransferase